MLLSISFQPSRRKMHPKRTLHLKCDVCGREFTKDYFAHIEKAPHHICSRKCHTAAQLKGGLLDEKKRQTMQDRYGVDNPQQLLWVKDKSRVTNLERYGTEVCSQSDKVKERARLTNQERYGVDWHTQSKNFADKSKKTWKERYGVDHPMRADEVKAKYDFKEVWRKAHCTKKLNGTYARSKSEDLFYARLSSVFDNVERQVPVQHENGTWLIDFRVGDVYVQFDGVYWHGLDRPIDEIIAFCCNVRDRAIIERYKHDRAQNAWFMSHKLRLVRITDLQAKMMSDNDFQRLITTEAGISI